MKYTKISAIMGVAIACGSLFNPLAAEAAQYKSEYSLSILGFPIGKSAFDTKIDKNSYTINGSLKAAGVAKLFTRTTGTLTAKGSLSSNKITSRSFDVRYKEGNKNKRTTISFSKGNVAKYANSPKLRQRGDWVELKKSHLKKVMDPMAGILVPAKSLRDVCSNTLKIFDGAMRADFPMRYVRTSPFSTKGYKGDAVTCRATFKPISGYDRKKRDLVWMRDKGSMEVSFAPIGKTGLYAPVVAKIRTRAGLATIRAKRFEALTK
ncbi:MAG: DUF3108 domain-containing protein [Pseudomonadota bacterium]